MAHDDGQLGKVFGHLADPFRTGVFYQAAVEENGKPMVLRRLHKRGDFLFVVGWAMLDQRMNLDPLESQLDPFLQPLKRILWPVAGTQPHETMNAPGMLLD